MDNVNKSSQLTRSVWLLILSAVLCAPCFANQPPCQSEFKGQKLSQQQFNRIVQQNKRPLNLCGTNLSRLDFSGLDLSGINLAGADLSYTTFANTNLSGATLTRSFFRWAKLPKVNLRNAESDHASFKQADLRGADLRQAQLRQADLSQAKLTGAQLSGAMLQQANFSRANLVDASLAWVQAQHANFNAADLTTSHWHDADLTDANLSQANLTQVDFTNGNLTRVDLTGALLKQTNFQNSNLLNAMYQPQLGALPQLSKLATSKNFNTLQFTQILGSPALAELQTAYKKLGVRRMERQLTMMLKVKDMHSAWQRGGWGYIESIFSYVMFYLTCNFGADPGRPLLLFLAFIFIFISPYYMSLKSSSLHDGIMISWPPHQRKLNQAAPNQIDYVCRLLKCHSLSHKTLYLRSQSQALRVALFFSVLSAFRLGWRDLNVGNWITRMQKRAYLLKGIGKIRMWSGIHALLSAYLVILWVLAYFGRPFEW